MILCIEQVILTKITTEPPILQISAIGYTNSTGWKNPRLSQLIYVMPPLDDIWEFHFVADKPSGKVKKILTSINASTMIPFPEWKGVKISAANNSKTVEFGDPLKEIKSGYFIVDIPQPDSD